MKRALPFLLLALLGCTSHATAPETTPATGHEAGHATGSVSAVRNPEFRNVQVLPHTMSKEQLLVVMRRFTQGLGVKCDGCHVVTATTPETQFDFPSDAKEEKRVARVMIQMTHQLNHGWMERVEAAEGEHEESAPVTHMTETEVPRINCWTCHRGQKEPAMPPPLPPRN